MFDPDDLSLNNAIRMTTTTMEESQGWPHIPNSDRFLMAREEVKRMVKAGRSPEIQLDPEHGTDINDAWFYVEEATRHSYREEALLTFRAMMAEVASRSFLYVVHPPNPAARSMMIRKSFQEVS